MENIKFKIYFHTDEQYFPSDFQYFTENATLIVGDQNLGKKTQTELVNFTCPSGINTENIYLKTPNEIKAGFNGDNLSQTPLYYVDAIYNNMRYRTFIIFYPYNGDYNLLLARVGNHWGDIERFTVEFDDMNNISRIYFGAHGDTDGRWVKYSDLEIEDGNIVLYSSKSGHGFYPRGGMYFRIFGLANDVTNKGRSLVPQTYIKIDVGGDILNPSETGLAYFCGKLGEGGIYSLMNRSWLYREEIEKNPPPLINPALYYIVLVGIMLLLAGIIYKIYNIGFRISKNNIKLYRISFLLTIILILLYIRNTILQLSE